MSDSTRDTPSLDSPLVLDYGRPVPLGQRLFAQLRPSHFAIVVGIGGFQLARTFGRGHASLAAIVGVFCAVLWVGFARVRWAEALGRTFSAWSDQLLIAGVASVAGVMAALARARMEPGPEGWDWWFTYNPGYAFGPRWALRPLSITAVGMAWYCWALCVAIRRERVARRARLSCPPTGASE